MQDRGEMLAEAVYLRAEVLKPTTSEGAATLRRVRVERLAYLEKQLAKRA